MRPEWFKKTKRRIKLAVLKYKNGTPHKYKQDRTHGVKTPTCPFKFPSHAQFTIISKIITTNIDGIIPIL